MTTNAWRQESETPSLSEVFRTIAVGNGGTSRFRRFLAFIGPGYLVAVGYMDPGNWATSLAGSGQNMGVMRGVFCLRRSADHRELRPL
jgi:manganese transport protein